MGGDAAFGAFGNGFMEAGADIVGGGAGHVQVRGFDPGAGGRGTNSRVLNVNTVVDNGLDFGVGAALRGGGLRVGMAADGAGAIALMGGSLGLGRTGDGLIRGRRVEGTGGPAGLFRRRTMGPGGSSDVPNDGTQGIGRRGNRIGTIGE